MKNNDKKRNKDKTTNSSEKHRYIVVISILTMLLFEAGIQIYSNMKMAAKTTRILLEQIVGIIKRMRHQTV